jgi:putative ABC transport system permease protein
MENRIVLANLLHRPIRTVVSVLAVAIEVGMVMLVVGMTSGLVNETAKRQEGVGADLWVQAPNASYFFAISSAPMPIKTADLLRDVPHVLAVAPVLFQFNSVGGINTVYGIDLESFNKVTGGFVYHSGGPLSGPYDMLVDDIYAQANHLRAGAKVNMFDHDWTIAGVVEHGKGSRLFVPIETLQDLAGAHNMASIFWVKCTEPGYSDDVIESIRKLLPSYKIISIREYMQLMTTNNIPGLTAFITALICVAVGIGFLVIFLSMYTTITERTREIGILKSLGASKLYVIEAILRESTFLCVIGILAGFGISLLARRVLHSAFPTLTVQLTVDWAVYAALLALVGSVLGAFYPALRAASLDPVDALAYE